MTHDENNGRSHNDNEDNENGENDNHDSNDDDTMDRTAGRGRQERRA